MKLYKKQPVAVIDDIECFSNINDYIDNYEKISKDHLDEYRSSGKNPFMDEEHWLDVENTTRAIIKKYIKPNIKILDVGVGTGRLLDGLAELDRYGMDISMGYLKEASGKNIKVCMSLVEDMPYEDGIFDIVVCTDVLEHVFDLNLAFNRIVSVLKDDGVLIIRVPYREDLEEYCLESCPYEFVHLRSFDEFFMKLFVEKINKLKLVDFELSGYISGRKKPIFDAFLTKKTINLGAWIIKLCSRKLYLKFLKLVNVPAEINFIIKK